MTPYLLGAVLVLCLANQGPQGTADPDVLYAARDTPGRAAEAARLWQAQLARTPDDFEAAWKLAKARYWLGTHGPEAERRTALEAGVEAGRTALRLQPQRPEGHFWMAANMGALAESFGLRQGLRYRGDIKTALERVLAIDPGYQAGSADRALGRWYAKVPGLFGGSDDKAEQHLRRSLRYDPDSTASLFFLAELYLDNDKRGAARGLLQQVVDAPVNPEWAPEDRDFKRRAARVLATLDRG
jgi:tetratricopeptide (TPR) repeat protein